MRHIKRHFHGVEVGAICTGTIHLFRCPVKSLLAKNIVTKVARRSRSGDIEEYVFLGFPTEDEDQFEDLSFQ